MGSRAEVEINFRQKKGSLSIYKICIDIYWHLLFLSNWARSRQFSYLKVITDRVSQQADSEVEINM